MNYKFKEKMLHEARGRERRGSYDFVHCTSCDFVGCVGLGDEICPKCGSNGCLEWANEELKEIDI